MRSTTKTKKKDIFQIAVETINNQENGFNVIIPNFCNNINVFSKGFSSQIASIYPDVKENYHLLGKNFLSTHPGYVQFIDVDREKIYNRRLIIANMIVKNGILSTSNKRPLNYAYLIKSMVEVKKYMIRNFNSENKAAIFLSKNTIKSTGANWNFVNDLIRDTWNQLEVDIFDA